MHWQRGGCELCSPVRVDTSAETTSHVRFRSPANRPCRSYSSGFCVEVRLLLENHTIVAANARTTVDRFGEVTGGSSRFVTRPFCELGPAHTDQVLGVIGRHFDGAVRADIDGPTREGIHGPDAGWGKQANPISFRVIGVLTALG